MNKEKFLFSSGRMPETMGGLNNFTKRILNIVDFLELDFIGDAICKNNVDKNQKKNISNRNTENK